MKPALLISGDRANITTLSLDLEKKELSVAANYPAPKDSSWIDLTFSTGNVDRLVGLSEDLIEGQLYTFQIDHDRKTFKITSQQPTLGAPAHFITLHDKSALALSTYLGQSLALYPISITDEAGLILKDTPRTEVLVEFPYKSVGHGPNLDRQRQCHPHQVLEDSRGLLYVPDLGADRVWIFRRDQMKLELGGWLQCPAGTGSRHAVFSPDEKTMYVIGELSHKVVAFDLSTVPAEDIQPIDGFAPHVIPPSVHSDHQYMMDASEIRLHPKIPNVLYVTNRWERHIAEREPHLENVPKELQPGDAIAIILLSKNGREVESVKWVWTNLDTIRGVTLSDDGKYAAAVGQEGGGIEVYEIGGERGDEWTLVASLKEGLEIGIKHVIWL
ncbi:putative isomerase YbhE [Rostrohypoxylon terebratum]|nr:putative isomerase YbhE [Rostrohypoxylon terebratum]